MERNVSSINVQILKSQCVKWLREERRKWCTFKTNQTKNLQVIDFAERDCKLLLNAGVCFTSTEGPMVAEVHLQKMIEQNPD